MNADETVWLSLIQKLSKGFRALTNELLKRGMTLEEIATLTEFPLPPEVP